MFSLLKDNIWLVSVAALIISLVSVAFVVIDKLKVWGDNKRVRSLKTEKAILYPLLNVQIDKYAIKTVEKKGYSETTIISAHFSELYNLFQIVDTSQLRNRELAERIETIKGFKADKLFECKGVPDGRVYSTQFSQPVDDVLRDIRKYLGEVI